MKDDDHGYDYWYTKIFRLFKIIAEWLRAIAGLDNVDWKVYIFAGWKVSFSTLDFLRCFFFHCICWRLWEAWSMAFLCLLSCLLACGFWASERAIDLLVELIFIFVSLYYSRDGSFWDFIKGCSDAGKKRGQAQLPENWFFLGFLSLIFFTF